MDVNLNVSTRHQYQRVETRQEITTTRLNAATRENRGEESDDDTTRLSPEARMAFTRSIRDWENIQSTSTSQALTDSDANGANQVKESDTEGEGLELQIDQKTRALMRLIEKMFHVKVELYDGQSLTDANGEAPDSIPGSPAGGGMISAENPQGANTTLVRQTHHEIYESEKTGFYASGEIELNDGRRFAVDFKLDMEREHYEEFYGEVVISGKQVDPLVINLNGNAAQLTNQRQAFDLDGDGVDEQVSFATGDSAFLAVDKDQNGKIDNGTELFGPQTGDSFAELAEHDDNGDGIIDENDSIFDQLVLTQRDENGNETLLSLKDAGIAGFYLAAFDTPFSIMDDNGDRSGVIRQTGVYIREDGTLDSMQHVDLVV